MVKTIKVLDWGLQINLFKAYRQHGYFARDMSVSSVEAIHIDINLQQATILFATQQM